MNEREETSQSFERYECWRPAFESFAVIAWALAFSWTTWLYFCRAPSPFLVRDPLDINTRYAHQTSF